MHDRRGGGFSFVPRNWGVCSATPAAGQPIDGALILNIRHFACGAKREFAGSQRVPRDLVSKNLQYVGEELDADNIEFTIRGDVNAIVPAEWGVCTTTPSGGQPIDGQLICTSATSRAVRGNPQGVSHAAVSSRERPVVRRLQSESQNDQTADGHPIRLPNVIDECSREEL